MMRPKEQQCLAWLRRGNLRKRILRFLSRQVTAVTPSRIAKELRLHRNKVSMSLTELRGHMLVKVINPNLAYDRLYAITVSGKRLVKLLAENERVRKL